MERAFTRTHKRRSEQLCDNVALGLRDQDMLYTAQGALSKCLLGRTGERVARYCWWIEELRKETREAQASAKTSTKPPVQ